jgi:hypothetical protein
LAYWQRLIEDSKSSRFLLDLLVERLWDQVRSKAMSTKEREHVEEAVVRIEQALGAPKEAKSRVIQDVRKAARAAED